jgi:hypothetical protein
MVRDKIKNGDLKITHHQNNTYASNNDANFLDDNNNHIFTITSSEDLERQDSPNTIKTNNIKKPRNKSKNVGFNYAAARNANSVLSLSQIRTESTQSQMNNLNRNLIASRKNLNSKKYFKSPCVVIPLVLMGIILLVGVISVIIYAIVSANKSALDQQDQTNKDQKDYFEDFDFFSTKSSTTTKSTTFSQSQSTTNPIPTRTSPNPTTKQNSCNLLKKIFFKNSTFLIRNRVILIY